MPQNTLNQTTNRAIIFILLIVLVFQLIDKNGLSANSKEKSDNQDTIYAKELGTPPGTYKILSDNGKIIIPFEIYRNKFRFIALVNGKECNLLLDNGSLWNELLFFGSPKVDSLGFEYSGETALGDTNVPNPLRADIAPRISLSFKDVVFNNQTAVVTRYDRNLPNLWEGTDGQVSATFFKHFVVKINFDESVIELIPPETFKYSGKGEELKMKLGPFDSRTITADIIMSDGKEMTTDLLIDLGGLYPLYLPIGKDDKITLPENAIESVLGDGLMKQTGYLGKVKGIQLGRYTLNDVLTAFIPVGKESDIYGNTMIGLPLLHRFNVIFDYFNNRIFLEPSRLFNTPFK